MCCSKVNLSGVNSNVMIMLKNPLNASTKLSMNGKPPMISTAPPFVLRLSKDERRVFQQNHVIMSGCEDDNPDDEGREAASYRKPFDRLALTNAAYQKRKATSRVKSGLSQIWLPGRDSNPRPIGYKCPDISARLGLSHHPC